MPPYLNATMYSSVVIRERGERLRKAYWACIWGEGKVTDTHGETKTNRDTYQTADDNADNARPFEDLGHNVSDVGETQHQEGLDV